MGSKLHIATEGALYKGTVGLLMAGSCVGLSYAADAVYTSYLLGAFMAGLAFSSVPGAQELWEKGTPPILAWLVLCFFACSVGFVIQVDALFEGMAVLYGLLVTVAAILGKFLSGCFAAPCGAQNYWFQFCLVGMAMVGRCGASARPVPFWH